MPSTLIARGSSGSRVSASLDGNCHRLGQAVEIEIAAQLRQLDAGVQGRDRVLPLDDGHAVGREVAVQVGEVLRPAVERLGRRRERARTGHGAERGREGERADERTAVELFHGGCKPNAADAAAQYSKVTIG